MSVSPQSGSCLTLTRGNKCRCLEVRVHSLARWSSPSSASWTSCWAHKRELSKIKNKNNDKACCCPQRVKPVEEDADRVVSFNVETTIIWLQSDSSEKAGGGDFYCEGHEWVPIGMLTCILFFADFTCTSDIPPSQFGSCKCFFLFLGVVNAAKESSGFILEISCRIKRRK